MHRCQNALNPDTSVASADSRGLHQRSATAAEMAAWVFSGVLVGFMACLLLTLTLVRGWYCCAVLCCKMTCRPDRT